MTKTNTINTMQPAYGVIQALGGSRKLSRDFETLSGGTHRITHSGICRWTMPVRSKGTGGKIPVKHWAWLLKVADSRGVGLAVKQMLYGHIPDVGSIDGK